MSANLVLWEQKLATGQIFRVVQGDLTAETTGAIVNATTRLQEIRFCNIDEATASAFVKAARQIG